MKETGLMLRECEEGDRQNIEEQKEIHGKEGAERERKSVCVCVCVCERERERERKKERERQRERQRERERWVKGRRM